VVRRTPTRLLAASLVLAVIGARIGWVLFFRESRKADALASHVSSMESEVAEFRDVKENRKAERARTEMRVIEQA
jgi:hypothetical protein